MVYNTLWYVWWGGKKKDNQDIDYMKGDQENKY